MVDTTTTTTLYESPQRAKNIKKYGYKCENQCICCMKLLKIGVAKTVHMNTNWLVVRADIDEEMCKKMTGAESQGCFQIGNDCAKKIPKGFIQQW